MTIRTTFRALTLRAAGLLHADEVLLRQTHDVLRVLNFHGTPQSERQRFREMVAWALDRFDILDPRGFLECVATRRALPKRRSLLFTFDDGLRSNYEMAAEVLEEKGHRGWFFVNPAFAAASPSDYREFFFTRVRYLDDPKDAQPETFTPMTRQQIADLSRRGHGIGSHTLSHAFLPTLMHDNLVTEVSRSRELLEDWTGSTCTAFAWTFAWDAISDAAWLRIMSEYRVAFGACPGPNRLATLDPHLIFRTNVESSMRLRDYAMLVAGLADPVWFSRRERLRQRRRALGAP